MRYGFYILVIIFGLWIWAVSPKKQGLAYSASFQANKVQLLVDEAWSDEDGKRQVDQEIFDSIFEIIEEAEQFILLDFFLMNEFLYESGSGMRPLSQEFSDRLIAKRKAHPEVPITFISDPVNTVYGSIPSPQFQAMESVGINVVWTDLDSLRDSNKNISIPWRLFVKPFGVEPGTAVPNPMGEGRISRRSFLKLLNFKANHRKILITEKTLLVTSANPHSGSSAHWNVALRVDGAGMEQALEAESAILKMSGGAAYLPPLSTGDEDVVPPGKHHLELLTEKKIKQKVLSLLDTAASGMRIDLCMFYLSDRDVITSLISAKKRGCDVRVILDPAKDAFGRIKNGIPNRQSAFRLVSAGIPLRWADTHGEQCHVKMLYVRHPGKTATLLLGSCNYTRRNMDNFNCECNLALTTSVEEKSMKRAREVFDRWWHNENNRAYTVDYEVFEDASFHRRLRAWFMERTGLSTF